MSEFTCHTPKPGVLALHGDLTVQHAQAAKQALLDALSQGERLEVDLLNVTKLDTAGVQLLVLLQTEAKERAVSLRWLGYSLAVEEVLELLDLGHLLGRPSAVVWS